MRPNCANQVKAADFRCLNIQIHTDSGAPKISNRTRGSNTLGCVPPHARIPLLRYPPVVDLKPRKHAASLVAVHVFNKDDALDTDFESEIQKGRPIRQRV